MATRWYPKINKDVVEDFPLMLSDNRKLVVELSNHRATSQLSPQKLSLILNKLYSLKPFSLIISLRPKDRDKAVALEKEITMPSQIVITPTLDSFIALINKSDAFLLGDGGASHIAGALDKPGVSLYGQTSVQTWRVLSNKVSILFDPNDVNNIPTDTIVEELLRIL